MPHPIPHIDASRPDVRVEFGLARAEYAARSASVAFADQMAAVYGILAEARAFPEIYLGPGARADRDSVEFAERAAVADIAVRLGVAEHAIRTQAHEAGVLLTRAPRVWSEFRAGEISAANARTIAQLIGELPDHSWTAFEHAVLERAATLAPARFRPFARTVRDRVGARTLPERHTRAAGHRRVWIDADVDGMCWLTAYLPAATAERAMARVDAAAVSLAAQPDETRTLAQLRADVTGDLLAGILGAEGSVGVSVAMTVPVLSLLGLDEAPATLDGYGPIDAETARALVAHAPSFSRILTHPISGAVLDVDRTTYRVPADLKRWLGVRDGSCTFPGCGRRTRACDLDHTVAW